MTTMMNQVSEIKANVFLYPSLFLTPRKPAFDKLIVLSSVSLPSPSPLLLLLLSFDKLFLCSSASPSLLPSLTTPWPLVRLGAAAA